MMFRCTKPRSPRGSSRVNVETIGGRRSRQVWPKSRLRNPAGGSAPNRTLPLCCGGARVISPPGLVPQLGPTTQGQAPPPKPPAPEVKPTDGALQLLGILQRDARILDFFMEDIAPYSDEQIGAAARDVHEKTREVLTRHF